MEITFKRRLTNELLTTFLPSFFLLGICYATIHFKSFYFEAAVTVNLTVMLVATTLFIRSSNIFHMVKYFPLIISVWWPNFLPPPTWGWLTSGWLQPNWSHSCWWLSLHPLQYLKMMWKSIIMDLQGKHLCLMML